jgi:hypothetical protein
MVAYAALFGAGSASAGMFATPEGLPDVSVDDDQVVYTTPNLNDISLQITASNKLVLMSARNGGVRSNDRWRERLNLGGSRRGGGRSGNFLGHERSYVTFGGLQPAASLSATENVSASLLAMASGENDKGSLYFLLRGRTTTAREGLLNQSNGLYDELPGLPPERSARMMAEHRGASSNLPAGPPVDSSDPSSEMPVPGSAMLLVAGILGWRLIHRAA